MSTNKDAFVFQDMAWDSQFFGLKCAKATLQRALLPQEWDSLLPQFAGYDLVTIENRNSEPENARLIGHGTNAFLVDVNIQFAKPLRDSVVCPDDVSICQALDYDEAVLAIADFKYSRFIHDPLLRSRGGDRVYAQWLINAFGKPDKHFALVKDQDQSIMGFALFSYPDWYCRIELIAVAKNKAISGLGRKLVAGVEQAASVAGLTEILVGTQLANIPAVNFYHRVGFKQVGCHQIYHLWKAGMV